MEAFEHPTQPMRKKMCTYIVSDFPLVLVLCPRVDLHLDIAIECLYVEVSSEHSLRESDVLISVDV